ncbi:hypothetical protein MJO28_007755 [Puccinia striiformis f. sp. tritici]|uniref:Uncharacterized protein n=1 Tax=Puccinia striiformis f. sp. tritici TaxID=168172 RepID=A0ACC0EFH3_9BASI|nr:hypothetical protein MJO28_007755 [Puccinia striiformis f. sp. tritici]
MKNSILLPVYKTGPSTLKKPETPVNHQSGVSGAKVNPSDNKTGNEMGQGVRRQVMNHESFDVIMSHFPNSVHVATTGT